MTVVAVTGATGFVGRATCQALLDGRFGVRALVRSEDAGKILPSSVARVVTGDLARSDGLDQSMAGCDVVIHLAARVRDHGKDADDSILLHTNAFITERVMRSAARGGAKRFVYVSSVKAVGERNLAGAWSEATEPRPSEPYGRSKLMGEEAARELGGELGMEVVVIRPPIVYGPGVRGNFEALLTLAHIARWIPLPLAGISNRRSTVSVQNLADALVLLTHHPAVAGETFFVADGPARSTSEIIRAMGAARGVPTRLFSVSPSFLVAMASGVRLGATMEKLCGSLEVDDARLRRVTGWAPPLSFEEGIRLAFAPVPLVSSNVRG